MNPIEYILQIIEDFQLIKIFVGVYSVLLFINWILFRRFFNGLYLLVFSSAIVFSVILDFYLKDQIGNDRLLYFIFSEVLIYSIVTLIYKRVINTLNKNRILATIEHFNQKYFYIAIIWLLLGITINLFNVSWDGTSRIAFQTARWFSIVRMISQVIDPTVGLLLIHNVHEKHKRKLIALSLSTIFLSASAGSKSGFVFSIVQSFLIYRDLVGIRTAISPRIYIPLIAGLICAALLNFYFLGVDFDKVFERIVHYAEATIMVFPSNNPCAACQHQSMIALIHRGIGRTFHDLSSMDINNLFGYALSAEFYGENTLTGPNARLGAYAICAFPGTKIVVLYLVFLTFLLLNYLLIKITMRKHRFLFLSSILLLFHGIQHFILDYNTAMADLTLILMLLIFLSLAFLLKLDLSKS